MGHLDLPLICLKDVFDVITCLLNLSEFYKN